MVALVQQENGSRLIALPSPVVAQAFSLLKHVFRLATCAQQAKAYSTLAHGVGEEGVGVGEGQKLPYATSSERYQ